MRPATVRVAPTIELDAEEKRLLTKRAKFNTTSVLEARRSKIVLLADQGMTNQAIAQALDIGRVQVGRWRERYAQEGLSGIEKDRPRGGRKRQIDTAEIVRLTTQT